MSELYIDAEPTLKNKKIDPIIKQQYNNKYYSQNKDILLQRQKEKVHCKICDKYVNRSSWLRHCKGEKHLLKCELAKMKN